MEILKFLLRFLSENYNNSKFAPIINLLRENSFDLNKILSSFNIDTVLSLLKEFMNGQNKNPAEKTSAGNYYGIDPIVNIADKDIVYTLNKYFYNS